MAWQSNSKTLIIKHQAYRINADRVTAQTLNTLIDQQMKQLLEGQPYLIPTIEADLATLETLDALLTEEEGSTANALIKADVLEWSAGTKTGGIKNRSEALRSRVANMLSQSIGSPNSGGGWGNGSLARG